MYIDTEYMYIDTEYMYIDTEYMYIDTEYIYIDTDIHVHWYRHTCTLIQTYYYTHHSFMQEERSQNTYKYGWPGKLIGNHLP